MRILRYALYPALLLLTGGYLAFELGQPAGQLGRHYGAYLATLVAAMVALEAVFPMRPEWSMTRATFLRRDLPYLLIGMATLGLAGNAAGWALRELGASPGAAHASWPLAPSVVLALALPEILWYWFHRWSHEARGRIGGFLWRVHLPHHMPRQLYVLMHAVAHPLGTIVVRLILTAPIYLLGFSAEAVFCASVVVALQGVVSHFNVDMRLGWLNYVVVGNELHRYHHSGTTLP
jgi:sterol desaturase/sphingolipid hydroxylase (fatty acid hydroxylase superfamily)